MSASPPEPGDAFAGHVIEAEIGRGGMGVVYRARNVALDRTGRSRWSRPASPRTPPSPPAFAARRGSPHRSSTRTSSRSTTRATRTGCSTSSCATSTGSTWRACSRAVPLRPERALAILRPVADALDAAHAGGLVHRDVKPANVLVEDHAAGERVYLTDFGISRPLAPTRSSGETATTALTGGGQVIGTADYVSPEAIEGGEVDARSDVYSLACLAYHLLAGRPPFARDSELATLIAHAKAERPAATALNPGLPPGHRRGASSGHGDRPGAASRLRRRLRRGSRRRAGRRCPLRAGPPPAAAARRHRRRRAGRRRRADRGRSAAARGRRRRGSGRRRARGRDW